MKSAICAFIVLLLSGTVFCKSNAIIEKSNTQLILNSENNLYIKEFKRVKILNQEGYANAVFYEYYDSFRKIRSLKYTIYDANNNRVRRYGKGDAQDVKFNSHYEINDARLIYLDPEYQNYPFTVEIETEIDYKSFFDFPVWMPRRSYHVEVAEASLTLQCYEGFEFRARELNGVTAPEVTKTIGMKTITWKVQNLPSVEKHLNYKSFAGMQPKVHLAPVDFTLDKRTGSFQTWASFGDWFLQLNEGRDKLSPQTEQQLLKLQDQFHGDKEGLIKAVYKLMQNKTRYISIQLGIGGYQCLPAEQVDRTGYGDCKALTNYMQSMLTFLKIPSNPILVSAGPDVPDILPDLPSNQFNHIYLAVNVNSDTLFFECTSQTAPPAFTGSFTDDRSVLWLEKGKSKIIRTPVATAQESVRLTNCKVKLSENGDATLDLNINQSGKYFDEIMAYQNLPTDRTEAYNYSKFSYKDFTIKEFKYDVPNQDKPAFDLLYKLQIHGLARLSGTKLIFPTNVLPPFENEIQVDVVNKTAEVRRAFTIVDNVEITIPDSFRMDMMPEPIKEDFGFGNMQISVSINNAGKIIVSRKIVLNKGNYQNQSFEPFYTALKKIRSMEQSKLVLNSKT